MPIFWFLSLGSETLSLDFETQKRLVFLGLRISLGEHKHFLTVFLESFFWPSYGDGTERVFLLQFCSDTALVNNL